MSLNLIAISGSLRKESSNTALMNAMIELAPDGMDFTVYGGLGDLPHFNPDLDRKEEGPPAVQAFRDLLQGADGVLICTPEYGNGVPGVLKNALDWLVSTTVLMNKPVAAISASPTPLGGDKAHASLLLTLGMINARVVPEAAAVIPHINLKLGREGKLLDEGMKEQLVSVLKALEEACSRKA